MIRNIHKICVALTIGIMSFTSCLNAPEQDLPAAEITVPSGATNYFENNMDFGFEGGTKTMSFSSNLKWSMKVSDTQNGSKWLTIDPASGNSGSNKVTFTAEENPTYEDRSVIVKLTVGDTICNIRVNQKRMEAITLTSDIFEVSADGGTVNVEVNYSTDYDYTIPDDYKSWIHPSPNTTRGLASTRIAFTIDPSDEYKMREGRIYFKAKDEEEVVKIYQAGSGKLVLSQNEYNLTSSEQEFSIDINSNFDFSMEMPEVDWLKENTSKTRGMSSHTLKFKVTENDDYSKARSAKIKFYDKNNSKLSETVVINQVAIGAVITLDTLEYSINKDKQNLDIDVKSNFDYNIDFQGSTWVKQRKSNSRSISSRLLSLTVDENTSVETRTAKIKLYDKNSSASIEVVLNQFSSAPTIIAEKKEYEVDANKQNLNIKVNSNVDYIEEIIQGEEWVTRRAASTRALATSTLPLTIYKNDSYDSRTAKIRIFNEDGTAADTVSIIQKAKNGIVIPTKEFTIDELGGKLSIEINSNIEYKLTINDDWIKESSKTRGLTSHTHIFDISSLGDGEDRKGTITVLNEDYNLKETITIKQRHALVFKKAKVNVINGKEYTLSITNYSDQSLVWSSSDESIATVTISGIVTGVKNGKAVITAKTIDGKHSETCEVTVGNIEEFVNISSSESAATIENDIIQPGSQLGWTIHNESNGTIYIETLQLIDEKTNQEGKVENIKKNIAGETSASYATPVEGKGMSTSVKCYCKFTFEGKEYTVTAAFKN